VPQFGAKRPAFLELLLEIHQGDRWALFSSVLDNHLLRMIGLVPAPD